MENEENVDNMVEGVYIKGKAHLKIFDEPESQISVDEGDANEDEMMITVMRKLI